MSKITLRSVVLHRGRGNRDTRRPFASLACTAMLPALEKAIYVGRQWYVVPWNGCGHGRHASRGGGRRRQADLLARRASTSRSRRRIPAGPSRIPKTGGARRKRLFAARLPLRLSRSEPIAAIGLTGQMHGAVMLDENGAVLRPALIWCDTRTQPECDWLTREDWLRAANRADLQPRAAQLHADEAAVGQEASAGDLRKDPPHHVPEGLCALPPHGRVTPSTCRRLREHCCWM